MQGTNSKAFFSNWANITQRDPRSVLAVIQGPRWRAETQKMDLLSAGQV